MTQLTEEDICRLKGYRFAVSDEEYEKMMEVADQQFGTPKQTEQALGALASVAAKYSSDTDVNSR